MYILSVNMYILGAKKYILGVNIFCQAEKFITKQYLSSENTHIATHPASLSRGNLKCIIKFQCVQ